MQVFDSMESGNSDEWSEVVYRPRRDNCAFLFRLVLIIAFLLLVPNAKRGAVHRILELSNISIHSSYLNAQILLYCAESGHS